MKTNGQAPLRSSLRHLDPETIREDVRTETRNREVRLPPVSTYRWWARRTEAINGAIVDAFSLDRGRPLVVSDPFAGGGVIPLSVILRGHAVYAQDLNPWAAHGLAAMLGLVGVSDELNRAANALEERSRELVEKAYGTSFSDGTPAHVSHTFRVATAACTNCGERARLFPHALISLKRRKEREEPAAFLACPAGHLFEADSDHASSCAECGREVDPSADYTSRRLVRCLACGHEDRMDERAVTGSWDWEVVLVERAAGRQRELAYPTPTELEQATSKSWTPERDLGPIPTGQETRVLLRHGFARWHDLYPRRQRYVLEGLLRETGRVTKNANARRALELAIIGSAEMAGLLSRWDRFYLKSYESMAGHRFNFTTFAAEPNVWGAEASGRGTVSRRVRLLAKAADWMHERVSDSFVVEGPVGGGRRCKATLGANAALVVEGTSERQLLSDGVVDLALTDPPYHDDVQYGELSLPLRAWAGLSLEELGGEALVKGAGVAASAAGYEELLARIFSETRRTLRDDGHLVFSYANREPEAWAALFSALQTAGFRSVGYAVLHSENETDVAKRGVRACTLDFVMDLAPDSIRPVLHWKPTHEPETVEEEFLELIGRAFLRIGDLSDAWRASFIEELRGSSFLAQRSRDAIPT